MFFVFQDSYVIYMCVMDIMNVLRTGMNMSISRIHIWLCYKCVRKHFILNDFHSIKDLYRYDMTFSIECTLMYFYGPPHMAEQKLGDQLEHTYSSYVRIRDVALKTCQRR